MFRAIYEGFMKGPSKLHAVENNINSNPNDRLPVVSVLIRTKNEEKHIGRILDALFSQSYSLVILFQVLFFYILGLLQK